MNIFKSRKFRQGSVATLITVLAIVLVVIVNMVATSLSERYSLTLDLTSNKIFSLSDQTKELLQNLDKDVNIYILSDEDAFIAGGQYYFASGSQYFQQASEIIQKYPQQNPRVRVVFKDIIKDPAFVANYPNLSLAQNNILVECGSNASVLNVYDIFNLEINYNTGSFEATSSKAEQAISSAILNVTNDNKVSVSVLEGHGEADIGAFTSVLEMNGFEVTVQNLMTDPEINPETDIVIMAAPMRDISEAESKKIDAYLSNNQMYGKTLFYMASAQQQSDLPVIGALLEEWGIRVNPGIVFDISNSMRFDINYFYTLANYMEGEYSKNVSEKSLPAALPNSRPLELLFQEKSYYKVQGLLEFSATSGIRETEAAGDWVPSQSDISGPITGLALSSYTKYDQTTPMTSNVLVSGSEELVVDYLIGSQNIANSEYVLDILNKLAGREEQIKIQNKTLDIMSLGLDNFQTVVVIAVVLTIVVPLAVLIFGIVIWLRRRHR